MPSRQQETSNLAVLGPDLIDQNKRGMKVKTIDGKEVELDFVNQEQYTLNRSLTILAQKASTIGQGATAAPVVPTTIPPTILFADHGTRINTFPAAQYREGDILFETDNEVYLVNELKGQPDNQVLTWTPRWANPIENSRINRSGYYAFYWPKGQIYSENDTFLTYTTQSQSYQVAVTDGITLTYTPPPLGSGIFDPRMEQYPVELNGIDYQLLSVESDTVATLATAAPNGNLTLTFHAYYWVFTTGTWTANFTVKPPAGSLVVQDAGLIFLANDYGVMEIASATAGAGGIPDWIYATGTATLSLGDMLALLLTLTEAGFRVYETDYGHVHRWNGTDWEFADGESSQYCVLAPASPPGAITTAGGGLVDGWYPCDGASHTCVNGDGSTSSIATPDFNTNLDNAALVSGGWNVTENPQSTDIPALPGGGWSTESENVDQTVQSGAGATVPNAPHVHVLLKNPVITDIDTRIANTRIIPANFTMSMWLRG